MAIYHIKPLTGNDANSGLSEVLAKQSYKVLVDAGTIVNGDTVILYNESNTEHLINFTGGASVTVARHFLTIQPAMDSDGNYVTLRARRDINNAFFYQIAGLACNRIRLILDQNNLNANNCYRSQALSAGGFTYLNCIIEAVNNPTVNSSVVWANILYKGSSGQGQAWKTEINGTGNAPLLVSAGYKLQQCDIHDHSNTTASAGNYPIAAAAESSFIRCRFWNLTAPAQSGVSTSANRRAYINFSGGAGVFIQNTVLCGQNNVAMIALGLDNTANTKSYQIYNNIFWSTVAAVSSYVFLTDATTIGYEQDLSSFIGFNFHNLTGENIAGVTGLSYRAGVNTAITTNPFLSTTIGNANFLKLNTSVTDCPGNGLADSSPGFLEVAVGGGTLLPVADVKIGVDRGDGSLGTYDGSDRWSDAGESNVKFGVQYKANSLTNNKTGNRTDANPINVKTGTGQYGANGTEFTPSYSPDFASPSNVLETDTTDGVAGTIPLSAVKATSGGTLPLNKIAPSQGGSYLGEESNDSITAAELKIGLTKQNLGNTINGTYDAIERYTDLDLSKVDSTYSFRFNSLTNNRTGTKVFYPLLPITDVKINVDRGDGQLGTYVAAERYSDPGEHKVKFGTAYKFNSLTDNKNGAIHLPAITDVRSGVGFGVHQTDIGTLDLPATTDVKLGVVFDNTTKTGTLESTDPGVANVVSGVPYKINSTSYVGTRTSIYPVLNANLVKIGQDRGDGISGTYDGAERYTDIDLSQVTFGYAFRFNSLTNNRTGARTAIYPLLPLNKVESGTDRGDGQLGTNKGEAFNSVLTPSLIKVGESIENLGETILGDYTASERYTQLLPEEVQNNKEYIYNNEPFTGTLTGGSIDPKYILTPFGTLGEINLSSMDYAKQARNQFLTVMSANLTGWKQADYLELDGLTKNSNVQNAKRYGIRILGNQIIDGTAGVIGREVVSREFEIVLTDSFINNQTTDIKARDCQDKIIEEMERVRRFINSTNFGLFSVPRIITDISENDCEFIDENNTIICRMRVKVQLKLNKS